MIITIVLSAAVFAYTVAYIVSKLKPILKYKKAKKHNDVKCYVAYIVSKTQVENKTINGRMLELSVPEFEYVVGNKKLIYRSSIKYQNAMIGQSGIVEHSEQANTAWMKKEFEIVKKELLIRVPLMVALIGLLIAVEIYI